MEREVDEAMPLFLREGGKIGKENHPICQPAASEADGKELLFLESEAGQAW